MCPTEGCIFVKGHGGEHFVPEDGQDHSDEIRLRILRDKVAELKAELEHVRSESRAALKRYGRHLESCHSRKKCELDHAFPCTCGLDTVVGAEKP